MLYDPRWEQPWRKVLLDAADLIAERGHCQRALERDGKFCMAGAMGKVGYWEMGASGRALAFARLQGYCGGSFVAWNNAEGRTKEEVIAALRQTANEGR